ESLVLGRFKEGVEVEGEGLGGRVVVSITVNRIVSPPGDPTHQNRFSWSPTRGRPGGMHPGARINQVTYPHFSTPLHRRAQHHTEPRSANPWVTLAATPRIGEATSRLIKGGLPQDLPFARNQDQSPGH